MALGVTFAAPDSDRFNYREPELLAQDQGRARRPRRGAGRLRRDEHRRGVRHPAADADRAPDGRPLGDERRGRPDRGPPPRRQRAAPARRRRGLARHAEADRRRGAPHRGRVTARGRRAAAGAPRPARFARATRCSSTRRSTRRTRTRPRVSVEPRPRPPSRTPRRRGRGSTDLHGQRRTRYFRWVTPGAVDRRGSARARSRAAEVVEQAGAPAEHEGHDGDLELVDQARRQVLLGDARAAADRTSWSPATSFACSSADSIPSVTKWNVVPPSISTGSRA